MKGRNGKRRNDCKTCHNMNGAKHIYNLLKITPQEVDAMLAARDGICDICKSNRTTHRLAIDHDHQTLKVRGVLCAQCNLGLGYFDDNIEWMTAAIEYLTGVR